MARIIRRAFGGFVLLVTAFLFVAAIRDVVGGALGAGVFVVLLLVFAAFGALGVWLIRGGKNAEGDVTLLMQDGSVQSVARGFVPGPATIGTSVAVGDMRAVVPAQMPTGDAKRALEAGDARLSARDWQGAMMAYQSAMTQYPATAPFALGNIGACLFMVGRYDEAIDHYQRATAAGANPIAMNDNVREAQEAKARGPRA